MLLTVVSVVGEEKLPEASDSSNVKVFVLDTNGGSHEKLTLY